MTPPERCIASRICQVLLAVVITATAQAQSLMIPEDVLFSKQADNLQPVWLMMIPDMPVAGFCPGLGGSFEELPEGIGASGEGLLVSAILVDKENRKVIDNIDCSFASSKPEVLQVIAIENNKRLYALMPKAAGKTRLTIKMGKEQRQLDVVVAKADDRFTFTVQKPDKDTPTSRPADQQVK